jgi:hypothetical protein
VRRPDIELDAKVDGDNATATHDKLDGAGKETRVLEKRDGNWLIRLI